MSVDLIQVELTDDECTVLTCGLQAKIPWSRESLSAGWEIDWTD